MYVRFTPKQLSKVKDFLKTASLKAYEIQIYNEIIRALENSIDEKRVKMITVDVENRVVGTTYSKSPTGNSKNFNAKQEIAASENINEKSNEKIERPQWPKDPEIVEESEVEPSKTAQDSLSNRSKSLDEAGIFGVIDNRTRK